MRNVFVALPAHDGKTYAEHNSALVQEILTGLTRGIILSPMYHTGDSSIVHCRNRILAQFLGTPEYSDLVFLDADVSWKPGQLLDMIAKPQGIVGGAYPIKRDPEDYRVRWLPDPTGAGLWANADGLIEVEGLPGGFMRITRDVVQDIVSKSENLSYYQDGVPGETAWMIYANPLEERKLPDGKIVRQLWGEDMWFCKYARSLGHKIWLSPDIEMGHTGNKMFTGSIGAWLKRRGKNGNNST